MIKRIKEVHRYFSVYTIKRKVWILSSMIFCWLLLLGGAFLSPNRQVYSKQQLKTEQSFSNGTGEINLISQFYSPRNELMILQFTTRDRTSAITSGINPKNLKWELFSKDKSSKAEMEVIPIIDGKISVLIRNVPKDFDVLAVSIDNQTVNTDQLIETYSSDIEDQEQEKEEPIQFFITFKSEKIQTKNKVEVTREGFTISELKNEINQRKEKISRLQSANMDFEQSISDDRDRLKLLAQKGDYLTGSEKEKNDQDYKTIQTSIERKKVSIKKNDEQILSIRESIKWLDKQLSDVKSGKFKFNDSIERIKMK